MIAFPSFYACQEHGCVEWDGCARVWRRGPGVIQSCRIFKPDRHARRDPRPDELLLERLCRPHAGDGGRDVPAWPGGDDPRARVARRPSARDTGAATFFMALLRFPHVTFAPPTG